MKANAFNNLWIQEKHYDNLKWETKLKGINGRVTINKKNYDSIYQTILEKPDIENCEVEGFFEPYDSKILEAIIKLVLTWDASTNIWIITDIKVINDDPFNDLNNPDNEDEHFITMSEALK